MLLENGNITCNGRPIIWNKITGNNNKSPVTANKKAVTGLSSNR